MLKYFRLLFRLREYKSRLIYLYVIIPPTCAIAYNSILCIQRGFCMVNIENKLSTESASPECLTSDQFNEILTNIDRIKSIYEAPNFQTLVSSFLEKTSTVEYPTKPRSLIYDEKISTTLYGTNYSGVSFFIRLKEEKNTNWLGDIKFCSPLRESLVIDLFADEKIILTYESPFDKSIVKNRAKSNDAGEINTALQTIEEILFIREVGKYAINQSFDKPPKRAVDVMG